MIEIKAPQNISEALQSDDPVVFLAGSIEMGLAVDWQSAIKKKLGDKPGYLFNPRRDAWDSSWEQSMANPMFKEQVEWELGALRTSDVKFFYFDPNTKSPVTLLELGLMLGDFSHRQNLIVVCPPGFWRRGNVEITCDFYGIKMFSTMDEGVEVLMDYFQ